MIKVNEIIKLLEEYSNVLKLVDSTKLQDKVNTINNYIESLKNLDDYIEELKIQNSMQMKKYNKNISKVNIKDFFEVLEKIKKKSDLNKIDEEKAEFFARTYPKINELYSEKINIRQFISETELNSLSLNELKLLYFYIFTESKSGTKQEIITSINSHFNRLDYYEAFENDSRNK